MKQSKRLVDIITKGIREKRGQDIVIADLSNIKGATVNYFVIYQGNSSIQVETILEPIGDTAREDLKEKPVNVIGFGVNQ